MNILITDDEPTVTLSTRYLLEELDCSAKEAYSAEEALELMKQEHFSHILLDIHLGCGLSGLEAIPIIHKKYPKTHIIVVTTQEFIGTVIQCFKQGASDYLTKPWRIEKLKEALNI